MIINEDYVFHINWEDRLKHLYRIGILAQLDDYFYLIIKDQKNAEAAYKNGFIGLPGFNKEQVYRSDELFDFFKSRILEKNSQTPCEELAETKAISMIDSFSVERISEKVAQKYKKIILDAYELQQKKTEKEITQNDRDSDDLPDIE